MLLLVCMLAAYLAVGAMAAGIMPRYVRPVICNETYTNFRRTTSTSSDKNIIGVFAAGDVRVKSLRQVVTAAADGAIAAIQAEKYLNEQE